MSPSKTTKPQPRYGKARVDCAGVDWLARVSVIGWADRGPDPANAKKVRELVKAFIAHHNLYDQLIISMSSKSCAIRVLYLDKGQIRAKPCLRMHRPTAITWR